MPRTNRVTKPEATVGGDEGGIKTRKKRRARPGKAALREIVKQQRATTNALQRAPFQRLVRRMASDRLAVDVRFEEKALNALQIVAEHEMVTCFTGGVKNMAHAKRVELMAKDWDLYLETLPPMDPLVKTTAPAAPAGSEEDEEEEYADEE